MKHLLRSIAAVAAIVSVFGCKKEAFDDSNLREVTFTAGWAEDTKTALQEDGKSIWWSPGDEISVFVGNGDNGGYKFTSTATEECETTTFRGSLSGSGTCYAVYPYNSENRNMGGTLITTIPAEQIAKEGSFADGALVSVAMSNDDNLYFRNACSGIKFTVAHDNINKIIFKPAADIAGLAGKIAFIADFNNPTVQPYDGYSETVTIKAPDDGCFKVGSYYYVALCPIALSSGLEARYYSSDGKIATYTTPSVEFHRGAVKRMYDKDKDLVFYSSKATIYKSTLLPDGVDKTTITDVSFIVNSDKTTEITIPSDGETVYFEQDGTSIKYYTQAGVYRFSACSELFAGWRSMTRIDLSNIDTSNIFNMDNMFDRCQSLTNLDLTSFDTSNVTSMSCMFGGCSSLVSVDLSSFNTSNVTNMGGMFGGGSYMGESIGNMSPSSCSSLTSLDLSNFDTSNVLYMNGMFNSCYNLSKINLTGWSTENVIDMGYMFQDCTSLKSLDLSSFRTSNVKNMGQMFLNCFKLESLDLSEFNTSKAYDMQGMFQHCESMKDLNIANFDASAQPNVNGMFWGCYWLKYCDLGSFDISSASNGQNAFDEHDSMRSKACAFRCTEATKQAILSGTINSSYCIWVNLGDPMPTISDPVNDLYKSVDYSQDGVVKILNKATVGNGVPIVIMGDAYTDKLIADGTYDKDMAVAVDGIFSIEPYKSFKDYFDVKIVYCVSENDVAEGTTALDFNYGMGNGTKVLRMSALAFPDRSVSDIAIIVTSHDTEGAHNPEYDGIAYTSYSVNSVEEDLGYYTDYGQCDESIMYIPRWPDDVKFTNIVNHELGHGFAKLFDEYVYSDCNFTIPDDQISTLKDIAKHFGTYKNVDFTNDPTEVKWSKYLTDSRYSGTGLGVYEGAQYATGIWKASEESIMHDATWVHGYNAPSREAIYYRINKLAFGNSWQYDHETFVKYDQINIDGDKAAYSSSSAATIKASSIKSKKDSHKPLLKIESAPIPNGKKKISIYMD